MKQQNGVLPDPLTPSTSPDSSQNRPAPLQNGRDEFAELRSLLIGPEQAKLAHLQEQLDNLPAQSLEAEDISRVLPEAILVRTKTGKDKQLANVLTPTVEAALSASAKKDPRPLIEAIVPLLGPAIRTAVSQVVSGFTQKIDQILEQYFSAKGWRWRWESWRTGKPFAEVVRSHTLLFQVEQVFLIHRKTGVLLQQVVAGTNVVQDVDKVSHLLAAVQGFVQDSFGSQDGEALDNFHIDGELTVSIEQGPHALLAAVLRGNPPRRLRRVFLDALENIHREQGRALEEFNGDVVLFEASRPYLEDCLRRQSGPAFGAKKRKVSLTLRLALAGLLVGTLAWALLSIRDTRRWTAYVERLRAEPGIVVVSTGKREGKRFITGLRDPLAADPLALLRESELDPVGVISQWEPYQALQPQFILARARVILLPPESVSLQFENGILSAAGTAPRQWIEEARKLARVVPGVAWFSEKELFDAETQLQEKKFEELLVTKEQLEKETVLFAAGTADLVPGQDATLQRVVEMMHTLLGTARATGQKVGVEIVGHQDIPVLPSTKQLLGLTRAERVLAELVAIGLPIGDLEAIKTQVEEQPAEGMAQEVQSFNRSVSFAVAFFGVQPPEEQASP